VSETIRILYSRFFSSSTVYKAAVQNLRERIRRTFHISVYSPADPLRGNMDKSDAGQKAEVSDGENEYSGHNFGHRNHSKNVFFTHDDQMLTVKREVLASRALTDRNNRVAGLDPLNLSDLTATTSRNRDVSFASSGIKIPPWVFSDAFNGLTNSRSRNILICSFIFSPDLKLLTVPPQNNEGDHDERTADQTCPTKKIRVWYCRHLFFPVILNMILSPLSQRFCL
jgi:hypothetical protein